MTVGARRIRALQPGKNLSVEVDSDLSHAMRLWDAVRSLRSSPWYTVTTVAVIGLTVALAATVFATVDGVLFRPLPIESPERLFIALGVDASGRRGSLSQTDADYLARASPSIAASSVGRALRLTALDHPELTIWAREVSSNFFDVIGERVAVGGFSKEDYEGPTSTNAPRAALVSSTLSDRLFGGGISPIGRTVDTLGLRLRFVGLLPENFVFPAASNYPTDVVLPLVSPPKGAQAQERNLTELLVRLRGTISVYEAHSRLDAAIREAQAVAAVKADKQYSSLDLKQVSAMLGRDSRSTFVTASLVASVLVLLGAINVGALGASRARDRERSLWIRAALGASGPELILLQLSEVLLLGLSGAATGLAFAPWILATVVDLLPPDLAVLKPPVIDHRVMTFAFLVAVLPLISVAVIPSAGGARRARLTGGYRTSSPNRHRGWRGGALLALESALGFVLIVSASLVVGGFVLLHGEQMGFTVDHLVLIDVRSPTSVAAQAADDLDRAERRLRAMPEVAGVARIQSFVLEGVLPSSHFVPPDTGHALHVGDMPISGGFFDITGLRLRQGRLAGPDELDAGAPVAVVSERVANAYWPGQSAVGQVLHTATDATTVIGVVNDAKWASQSQGDEFGQIYIPGGRVGANHAVFLLDTAGEPRRVAEEARVSLRLDVPDILIKRAEAMSSAVSGSIRFERLVTVLFVAMGTAALVIVAIGAAGLAAVAVARRNREVAIRMTLGSTPARIVRLVVWGQVRSVLIGMAAGGIVAWWVTMLMRALVYKFAAHDARMWAVAAGLIVSATAVAAWVPGRRAGATDPSTLLHSE